MKKPMIKLNDGSSVSLEEFNSWTSRRQKHMTTPIEIKIERGKKISENHRRSVITPMGVFKSMKEAVEKTGITISRFRRLVYSEEFPEYRLVEPIADDKNRVIKKLTQKEKDARQKNKALSRMRSIITPKGEFPSVTAASIALKLWRGQLTRLLQNPNYPEYRYSDSKPQISENKPPIKPNRTERVRRPDEVMTPKGHFVTKIQAALAHNISSKELEKLFISKPEKYYLIPLTRQTRAKRIKRLQS